MSKKNQGTLADQLKGVSSKLAADKDAAEKAAKNAALEKKRQQEAKRAAADDALSDEERFERAMSRMGSADVVKKFDSSRPVDAAPKEKPEEKRSDDDVFLSAV